MHFRERNRVIQIIRTVYNPDTKKGQPEIVGRIPKASLEVSDELRRSLSAEELAEVEAWLTSHGAREHLIGEHAVKTLSAQLTKAGQWFAQQPAPSPALSALAAEIAQAAFRLQKQLRRQGHLPPKPKKKHAGTEATADQASSGQHSKAKSPPASAVPKATGRSRRKPSNADRSSVV